MHEEIGSLNPLMLDEENRLVVYGIRSYISITHQLLSLLPFFTRSYIRIKQHVQLKNIKNGKNFRASTVTGFALMLRHEVFNKVNGFDENIYLYEEDVDIGLMLCKGGYLTLVFINAQVIHYGARASKQMPSDELIKMQTYALKTILKKQFHYSWWIRLLKYF